MAKFNTETRNPGRAALLLFFFVSNLFAIISHAQSQTNTISSIFEKVTEKEANHIQLNTDLTKLNGARKSDDYQPAILTDVDGRKWKVEVKSRGKFRRKNGYFPPIKIKFAKKELKSAGYSDHNGIRVTLPYYEGQQGDDLIVREYLTYRMFEHLSAASIRARLVKITLSDSHVESWKHEIYAIFMEDDDELCARLDAHEEEVYGLDPDSLQANQAALVSTFNYMIGNADWEVAGIRNVKQLRSNSGGKIVLIPYDFDFSGVVNAPYSKPAHLSGLKTIKQRFLMADGIKPEHLRRALAQIEKERAPIRKILVNKHLSSSSQREIGEYLTSFFDNLVHDNAIEGTSVTAPLID
jgi:hypothetical protein